MKSKNIIDTALKILQPTPEYPYEVIIDGVLCRVPPPPPWVTELRRNGITVNEGAWGVEFAGEIKC